MRVGLFTLFVLMLCCTRTSDACPATSIPVATFGAVSVSPSVALASPVYVAPTLVAPAVVATPFVVAPQIVQQSVVQRQAARVRRAPAVSVQRSFSRFRF